MNPCKEGFNENKDCDSCDEDNDQLIPIEVLESLSGSQNDQEPICVSDFLCIGSHVSLREGRIYNSLKRGLFLGMYVQQLYLGNRQQYHRSKIYSADLKQTLDLLKVYPSKIFIHASLACNLAGSCKLKKFAWDGDDQVDKLVVKMIEGLDYELNILNQLSPHGRGVVLHPGYWIRTGKETPEQERNKKNQACLAVSKSLDLLKTFISLKEDTKTQPNNARILLENCAGQRGKLGVDLEELNQIRNRSRCKDHIGFCIDTAHVHGAGWCDLRTNSGIDKLFSEIDKYGHTELIHLNDSKAGYGSLLDRHQLIGFGTIWRDNIDPLLYFLLQAKKRNIPLLLETSPYDMYTLHVLSERLQKSLIN
mgnify:CR=1 FL=1